jgi:hypothetical protein
MANVHRVVVIGWLPFNTYDYTELNKLLGQLNSPTSGLRIKYTGETQVGPTNEHGGRTTFYRFRIEGEDAVRGVWIEWMADSIRSAGGKIVLGKAEDIEFDADGQPILIWSVVS